MDDPTPNGAPPEVNALDHKQCYAFTLKGNFCRNDRKNYIWPFCYIHRWNWLWYPLTAITVCGFCLGVFTDLFGTPFDLFGERERDPFRDRLEYMMPTPDGRAPELGGMFHKLPPLAITTDYFKDLHDEGGRRLVFSTLTQHALSNEHLDDILAVSPELGYLDLENNPSVTNCDAIGRCSELTHLYIRGTGIESTDFLTKLNKLTDLAMSNANFDKVPQSKNGETTGYVKNLSTLSLESSYLSQSCLAQLSELTTLALIGGRCDRELRLDSVSRLVQLSLARVELTALSVFCQSNLVRIAVVECTVRFIMIASSERLDRVVIKKNEQLNCVCILNSGQPGSFSIEDCHSVEFIAIIGTSPSSRFVIDEVPSLRLMLASDVASLKHLRGQDASMLARQGTVLVTLDGPFGTPVLRRWADVISAGW